MEATLVVILRDVVSLRVAGRCISRSGCYDISIEDMEWAHKQVVNLGSTGAACSLHKIGIGLVHLTVYALAF